MSTIWVKTIILIYLIIITSTVNASVWYYGSGEAVNLEDRIKFFPSDVSLEVSSVDPTSSAVTGATSSVIFYNGNAYVKQDSGLTTNWNLLLSGSVDLTSDVSGILPIANGGTATSSTQFVDLTTNVAGILPVVNGGTGTTTPAVIFDGDGINVTAKRDSFKFDNDSSFSAPDSETVSFSHLKGEGSQILNSSPYKMFGKKGFAEYGAVSDFSTGSSTTFDGGGTIGGTLATSTTDLLETSDSVNWIFTQASGSLNDYFYQTITTDEKKNIGFRFLYSYDGDDSDLEYEAKCTTSGDILTDNITTTLKAMASSTPVAGSLYIPAGCGDLKFGFSTAVENIGQIFRFNRLSFTDNPYVDKDFQDENTFGASITNPAGTASISRQSTDGHGNEFISSVNRTAAGKVTVTFVTDYFSAVPIVVATNTSDDRDNISIISISTTEVLISTHSDDGGTAFADNNFDIIVHRAGSDYKQKTSHVIAYNSQNAANLVVEGAGNGGTSITANFTDVDFLEVTDEGFGGANWNGSVFTAPSDGSYHFTGMIRMTASVGNSFDIYKNTVNYRMITGITSTAYKPFSETIELLKDDTISIRSDTSVTLSNSTLEHHIAIAKLGVGDLLGVPKPLIGYVTHEEVSGTHGGTATSGDDATGFGRLRVLNNSYGDFSKFGTLSANIISLDAGVYDFEIDATNSTGDDSAIKMYNDTENVFTEIVSVNARGHNTDNSPVSVRAVGSVTITSKTDFTLQHKIDTTVTTTGYGIATAYGTETYVKIKITKRY